MPKTHGYSKARIIGGKSTDINVLPYIVSLQKNGKHYCGASIISKDWVLTAAHCTNGATHRFKVKIGSKNINDKDVEPIPVDKFIVHDGYYKERKCANEECTYVDVIPTNDISLVHLKYSITLNKNCQPIQLFEANESVPTGALATTSGWGDLGNGTYPDYLQSVEIPIVSKEECSNIFDGLSKGQICAGYVGTGGKDTCESDSGGPLAVNGRLAGVTSWGFDCGSPEYPGVYTEVSFYRAWIKRNCKI